MFADPFARVTRKLTLGEYISALVSALGAANPGALARMRQVVGDRRAQVVLDNEAVYVSFGPASLEVRPASDGLKVHGSGRIQSTTVLDLLDGYTEVSAVLLDGRLEVTGRPEDIARMFTAIEILLDSSAGNPALQMLATRFRRERQHRRGTPAVTQGRWYPFSSDSRERELLARLDLLPDVLIPS